jgi:L-ascorbate metabolism protein UlaG (beta-lactamase superfamily)
MAADNAESAGKENRMNHRLFALGALVASLGLSSGLSALTPAELAKDLSWVSQACLRLPLAGKLVYTDPLNIKTAETADIILITHNHQDHWSAADIARLGTRARIFAPFDAPGATRIQPGQSVSVDGLTITAVPAYNLVKTKFHPKSANFVGYLLSAGGVTVYVAGDTERIPEMKTFKADIAIVPLGQTYTMNSVAEAVDSVLDVQATIAFPYHWGLYEGSEADAKAFVSQLQARKVQAALLPAF